MISSLETGAIFKIVDEASPAILKIADSLKELQGQIDAAKESFTALAKSGFAGLTGRIDSLAGSLGKVEESSGAIAGNLDRAMLSAAGSITSVGDSIGGLTAKIAALNTELAETGKRSVRTAETAAASTLLGGPVGSGTPLPGWNPNARPAAEGGGRPGGQGIGLREGGHLGPLALGGPGGFAAMGGAAALGWGIWDEFKMEHEAAQSVYGSNDEQAKQHPKESIDNIRKMAMDQATSTGINPLSIATGIRKMTHLLSGSGGMSYDAMMDLEKDVLSYAAGETLTKGTSIEGNAESFVEMAHQAGIYDKAGIETMLSAIQAGGVMTPAGLPQVTGALSYSLQQLSAKHLIDSKTDIADVIAMQRMGILRTKSGTWVRDFYEHLLPDNKVDKDGNPYAHDRALQDMGLADRKGNLLWHAKNADGTEDFGQEQANIGSILSGYAAKKLSQGDRGKEDLNQDLHNAFGQQGGSFAAILADPKYAAQVKNVMDVLNNFKGGDLTAQWFAKNDPSVEASKTFVEFQKDMMDFAKNFMPLFRGLLESLNATLRGLSSLFGHAAGTDGKTFVPDGIGGGTWQQQSFDGSTAGLLHRIGGGDLGGGGRGGSGTNAAIAIDKAVIAINQGALTGGGAGAGGLGGGFMNASFETGGGSGGPGSAAGGLHSGGGYTVRGGDGGGLRSGGGAPSYANGGSDAQLTGGFQPHKDFRGFVSAGDFYSALVKKGFTPMAARGVLGNAMYESGGGGRGGVYLDPPTDAFHYNWGTGDAAVGAMQFEGKRRYGFDPTLQSTIDHIWAEYHGAEAGSFARLQGASSPAAAAALVNSEYERPQHPWASRAARQRYASGHLMASAANSVAAVPDATTPVTDAYAGSDFGHREHDVIDNHIALKISEKTIATAVQRHIVNANRQVFGPGKPDYHGHMQPVDSGYQWDR